MVIGDSPWNPDPFDEALRDRLEGWGYSVSFIQDDDSQNQFNSAIANNDVVLVSESVNGNNVGNKLTNTSTGVGLHHPSVNRPTWLTPPTTSRPYSPRAH